ncbi:MAG: hypothetical protein WBK88_08880, partial [Methanothrix sp.]
VGVDHGAVRLRRRRSLKASPVKGGVSREVEVTNPTASSRLPASSRAGGGGDRGPSGLPPAACGSGAPPGSIGRVTSAA